MRSRRVFGTTGDQIEVDFRLNGVVQGQTTKRNKKPRLSLSIKTVDQIESVEILRNSRVIEHFIPNESTLSFHADYIDEDFRKEKGVLYYYVRIIQKNKHIAWSSPIWLE